MSKQWFYSRGGADKQGPVPEEQIKQLVAGGTLKSSDLVWSEGMADWATIGSQSEFQAPMASAAPAPAASTPASAVLARASQPTSFPSAAMPGDVPDGMLGWMTFVGVVFIIMGVLECLTCVGIIVGIPLILAGTALLGAKSELESLTTVDPEMLPFLNRIKTFVIVLGVFFLIGIVSTIAFFLLFSASIFSGFASAMEQASSGGY